MSEGAVFEERLTGRVAPDAWATALPILAFAGGLAVPASPWLAAGVGLLGLGVGAFFRNPERTIPGDERDVVAPADGRVIAAGEVELPDGSKAPRVGIFLSIFDVHINRAPVAGRVVGIERGGEAFLAAFDPAAESRNVRLAMDLETARGERVRVVQISGLVARRIVCHAKPGEWVARGARYGLIRFGSRTDVILPRGSRLAVGGGERVRGGETLVARLPGEA